MHYGLDLNNRIMVFKKTITSSLHEVMNAKFPGLQTYHSRRQRQVRPWLTSVIPTFRGLRQENSLQCVRPTWAVE